MLSKLYFPKGNDKLFYLFLKEYCCYDSILIDQIRNDIKFWDLWLGKNTFDFDFLKETFTDKSNFILLAFKKNDENIYNHKINLEGIVVFNKFDNLFYYITLLAKRVNSYQRWLGKKLINKLNNLLLFNLDYIDFIVLTDVSEIPNYYSKLGFTLTNNDYIKKLLDNDEDDIYFKKLTD